MVLAGVLAVAITGVVFGLTGLVGNASDGDGNRSPVKNPSVSQLAEATVQIIGLDSQDQPMCSGSGTLVSSDGTILTNAHVVTREPECDFASLGIAVTTDSGHPPELRYRADLLAIDPEADLAVVRVAHNLDGLETEKTDFPSLALGDSDLVEIGDNIRILGYPEIGGDTITYTNGSVSGFTAQAGIGDRALIKTDATIAGGNSGGAAVDDDGRLIGIPTKARASEDGPAVDCRPLADTNGDGAVDNKDNCVPIGGFLNGLRPVNLAIGLIAAAKNAEPQVLQRPTPAVQVNMSTVTASAPRFSLGQDNDAPVKQISTAVGGIEELCLFVNWKGIPDGASWDGVWYVDGDLVEEYSLFEQTWKFGPAGTNFWMCAIDQEDGLGAGLYELGFFLGGELLFAEGIVLTDDPVEVLSTIWTNATDVDVCELAVNPKGSGLAGLNELPAGVVIAPGDSLTLRLPLGTVVAAATDCNGNPVADSAGEIEIEPNGSFVISRPTDIGEVVSGD